MINTRRFGRITVQLQTHLLAFETDAGSRAHEEIHQGIAALAEVCRSEFGIRA
jgi:hypothetical protein